MTKSSKSSVSKTIIKVMMIIPSLLSCVQHVCSLAEMEAGVARRNIVKLLIFYLLLGALFTTVFVCLNAMLFFYFTSIQISVIISLFIVFLINLLCLAMIVVMVLRLINSLTFPATRELVKKIINQ